LRADGAFVTDVVSCADDALEWLEKSEQKSWLTDSGDSLEAAGIDAPMSWSSGKTADRRADQYLRKRTGPRHRALGAGPLLVARSRIQIALRQWCIYTD
jgi:hypothetical protein